MFSEQQEVRTFVMVCTGLSPVVPEGAIQASFSPEEECKAISFPQVVSSQMRRF